MILGVASVLPALLVLYIRYYLVKENKRRDAVLTSRNGIQDTGVIESTDADGHRVTYTVESNQLDLTDRENPNFRYVL